MLRHLSHYLLQYGRVCVPHVGTLRLVQRPPALNVADKTIEPPSYVIELQPDESVSDHQLGFLHNAIGKQQDEAERELRLFGTAVQKQIGDGGFQWDGLGRLESKTQILPFHVLAMQPVAAEKIIRQEATHNVLVGDRELTSAQAVERVAQPASPAGKKRTIAIAIGWVLLLLAVLAIAVLLYLGKFTVAAAGSKLSPVN